MKPRHGVIGLWESGKHFIKSGFERYLETGKSVMFFGTLFSKMSVQTCFPKKNFILIEKENEKYA